MKHIDKKIDDWHIVAEEYRDFREFGRTQDRRDTVWTSGGTPVREQAGSYSWERAESYEQARGYLENGYNENVERLVKGVNALANGQATKTKRYADMVGYQPIVPNAVMGLPKSMMNHKKVKVKAKIITIAFDPGVMGSVKPESVLEYGCKFINWVQNLEAKGYRVRIEFMKSMAESAGDKEQYILLIPLKSENQPLNIKRMSFALTHVAMQRYLVWDWAERLPGSKQMWGFGCSFHGNARKHVLLKNAKAIVESVLGTKAMIVHYGMDLDRAFEEQIA